MLATSAAYDCLVAALDTGVGRRPAAPLAQLGPAAIKVGLECAKTLVGKTAIAGLIVRVIEFLRSAVPTIA